MPKLFIFNTLTGKKEEFRPITDGHVGIYSCGPTVYNFVHIGNLRAYVFDDILVRTLRYNYGSENVKWVMNITDVDDKTIRDSKIKYPALVPKEALLKFTREFTDYFLADLDSLNIGNRDEMPRATDDIFIESMKDLIRHIYSAKLAYINDGSVYFDVLQYSQMHKYGQLVNLDVSKLKAGLRIDIDEYEKDNLQDFVLWKGAKEGEPYWDFELAGMNLAGRPGWHIECSAMSNRLLGCPFDIHAGGGDLKFPHHEDEIAQSVAGFGVEQPVNYWLHNGMLQVDGKKMSKSLNNFYRLSDIKEKVADPLAFRYLCLLTHYKKPLNFTWEALEAANNALEEIKRQVAELFAITIPMNGDFIAVREYAAVLESKPIWSEKFTTAINDDLNTPKAVALLHEMLKSELSKEEKLGLLNTFDRVLGLKLSEALSQFPDEVIGLAKKRNAARLAKDWTESDRLRQELENLGCIVEDTKEGTKIIKK